MRLNTTQGFLGHNLYVYCVNNPIVGSDYSGEKPGDLFNTIDEAAKDFSIYTNGKSIQENREYASYIHAVNVTDAPWLIRFLLKLVGADELVDEMVETKYTYNEPLRGQQASVYVPPYWYLIHNVVAVAHTHGAYSPSKNLSHEENMYYAGIFSDQDKTYANMHAVLIYVATPIGIVRRYDPADGNDIVLFAHWDGIPFDSNIQR